MIKTIKQCHLELFYENDIQDEKIPAGIVDLLFMSLHLLDAAAELKDLKAPLRNKLKALDGQLKGKYAIRVNKQYRLIFNWDEIEGAAENVYLDAHDYR